MSVIQSDSINCVVASGEKKTRFDFTTTDVLLPAGLSSEEARDSGAGAYRRLCYRGD